MKKLLQLVSGVAIAMFFSVQSVQAQSISLNPNSTEICSGNMITFTANAPAGTASYYWYFSDSYSGYTGSSVEAHYYYYNSYNPNPYVQVTFYDAAGYYLGDAYQYITVKAGADSYFYMSNWSICPNTPVSFYYYNDNNNATSYQWDFGDGTTSTLQSPVHTYTATNGYFPVKLVVATTTCGNDTLYNGVYVDNALVPYDYEANFSYYASAYCPGLPISFYPYYQNFASYAWDFGDGTTSTDMSPVHTYSAIAMYTPTLTVTNACGNSAGYMSYSINVSDADVDFSGSSVSTNSPACPNDNIYMNVSFANIYPDYCVWDFGDGSPLITSYAYDSHSYSALGDYTVTVTAYKGCDDTTLTSIVSVNNNVPVGGGGVSVSTDPLCPGQSYAFQANPWGMKSYTWNFGDGSPSETTSDPYAYHSFSSTGSYTVSLILTNNCDQTYSVTPKAQAVDDSGNFPTSMWINSNSMMGTCPNDEVTFEFGSGGGMVGSNNFKSYLWSFGDGTATKLTTDNKVTHAYTAAGVYSCSVTVTNYCDRDTTIAMSMPTTISSSVTPMGGGGMANIWPWEICAGSQAHIEFNQAYGYASYFWDFDDGQTEISDKPRAEHIYAVAGYYNATMIVTTGCNQTFMLYAYPNVYNDAQINQWDAKIDAPGSACPNNSVSFKVGGSGYSSIEWNFGDGTTVTTSNWEVLHTYTTTGVYSVSAKVMTDCDVLTVYSSININNNSTISNVYLPSPGPSCPGDAVSLSVKEFPDPMMMMGGGGNNQFTNDYTANWSFGDGSSEQTIGTDVSHSYAVTGDYNVTVVVSNACGNSKTITGSVSIINNAPPDFGGSNDGKGWGTAGGSSVVGCVNDAVLFYMDGTGTNSWDFGDGTPPVSATEMVETENGPALIITRKFTTVGTKWVKLTKTNGCGASATDSIAVTVGTNAAVNGFMFIEAPANGAYTTCSPVQFHSAGGVSYNWVYGDGSTQTTSNPGASHTYSSAGTYYVSVTVTNGCGNKATYNDAVVVTGASGGLVTVSVTGTNVSCNGGTNGTATASASGGTAPYTYSWSTSPKQTSSTAAGLAAGSYAVIVTESNGCSGSANVTITQPTALTVSTYSVTSSACGTAAGSAYVTASGGTSPYTYSWSNGTTGNYAANLGFGTYMVTATGANGCNKSTSVNISELGGATVSGSPTDVACNGATTGAIDITVTGGTTPYTYLWSNESTAEDLSGLSAGEYDVTVTTADGCRTVQSIEITEPAAIEISTTTADADCGVANGEAEAIVTGGISPYSYSWNTIPAKTTQAVTGLTAKIYEVAVTDANGCVQEENVPVSNVNAPDVVVNETHVTCNGEDDGVIDLTVTGGTPPYSYLWVGDGFYIDEDISGLAGGKYSYLITDAFQCKSTGNVTINEPDVLTAVATVSNAGCAVNDGSVVLTVSGGNDGLVYTWSNSQTDSAITDLAAGVYSVNIADSKGCTTATTATVSIDASTLALTDSINKVRCMKDDGSVSVMLSGGTSPYLYAWSNGQTSNAINNLTSGTYSLTVTDARGCVASIISAVEDSVVGQPICVVTVDPVSRKNVVVWEKTGGLAIKEYNIYVETATADVYAKQGTVPFASMSIYQDNVSNPANRSFRYKVSAVDSCGNESELSDVHKTMHLSASFGTPSPRINLSWENYEGLDYGQFRIWKGTNVNNAVPIDSVPNNIFSYTDENASGTSDSLYYFMEIVADIPCVASEKTSASSNYNSAKSNTSITYNPNTAEGIKDNAMLNDKLSVYPNPTDGSITMNLLVSEKQNITIRVFDIHGQMLYTDYVSNYSQGRFLKDIDLSVYSKGIYQLQVVTNEGIANKKIILE